MNKGFTRIAIGTHVYGEMIYPIDRDTERYVYFHDSMGVALRYDKINQEVDVLDANSIETYIHHDELSSVNYLE